MRSRIAKCRKLAECLALPMMLTRLAMPLLRMALPKLCRLCLRTVLVVCQARKPTKLSPQYGGRRHLFFHITILSGIRRRSRAAHLLRSIGGGTKPRVAVVKGAVGDPIAVEHTRSSRIAPIARGERKQVGAVVLVLPVVAVLIRACC